MENKLEFHTSKKKMIKLIFISSIITFIGINCLNSNNWAIELIGYLNLFIGIPSIIIGLYNFTDNRPQLILTDLGIKHRKITKNIIPWNRISKAEITQEKNQSVLILEQKEKINLTDFHYIFQKTAKTDLNKNIIKLNIEQLIIDYSKLNHYLILKLKKNVG